MNFKNKLDFCIIPSPYSGGLKNLFFVAYHGTNQISEKLCLDEDYEVIRYLLNGHGYQEIDFCVFESSTSSIDSIHDVVSSLSKCGLKYSKPFEFNVMGELDSFKRDAISSFDIDPGNSGLLSDSFVNGDFVPTTPGKKNLIIQMPPKSKVPEVGEKIKLNFYLFIQCIFVNENDCILELVGDLYSKENNNTRNFLHLSSSDFVRLESNVPGVILLQSKKTYQDFADEISFLHQGSFRFVKPIVNKNGETIMRTKEFIYNIMEIKKSINPSHRIVVEVNLNHYYDDMIKMSKKIKREMDLEFKKIISLDALKPDMIQLKQRFNDKMIHFSENDEFEKAALSKKHISFIEEKISTVDSIEDKNITKKEFYKTFCLKQ